MHETISYIYTGIVKGYKNSSDISILTGSSGKILFLSYLYYSTKKRPVLRNLENVIEHTIEIINSQSATDVNLTYGGGVAGFYWVINHVYQNKLLYRNSSGLKEIITDDIDISIAESLQLDFSTSRYDPLYGYVGKGLYFASKPENDTTRRIIQDILNALRMDRVNVDGNRMTWVDIRRKYEEKQINNERLVLADCGQAHGVTGIISFLCTILTTFKSEVIKKDAESLLRPAIDWLLAQEIPAALRVSGFMFPSSINLLDLDPKMNNGGRLGWCYGDNIIAFVLYKAASILNEERYRKKADEITFNSCKISVEQSGVMDRENKKVFNPTICHGSAGIASIYQGIYRYNESEDVLKALNQWKNLTNEYTHSYTKSKLLTSLFSQNEEAFDFLYGYTGIGLYLISDVYSSRGWESCIMLN